jgi:NitT/TauT family transport system substrate-binding protein
MNDERMAAFFAKMVRAGVARRDIDYRKSYTLRFVNKAVGVNLRARN